MDLEKSIAQISTLDYCAWEKGPFTDKAWRFFRCEGITLIADDVDSVLRETGFGLSRLTITRTFISDVPENVCRLKFMEDLDISYNRLRSLVAVTASMK